jgi:hypothetical protein
MFSLEGGSGLNGSSSKIKANVYQKGEDLSNGIKGYDEIPRSQWNNIIVGSHVKYMKTDGSFCKHAFIRNINQELQTFNMSIDKYREGESVYSWIIKYDQIDRLYVKHYDEVISAIEKDSRILDKDLKDLKNQIIEQQKVINSLKEEVENLKKKNVGHSLRINNIQDNLIKIADYINN